MFRFTVVVSSICIVNKYRSSAWQSKQKKCANCPRNSPSAHRHRISRQRHHPEDHGRQGVRRPAARHRQQGRRRHGEHRCRGATIKHPNGATIIIPARPFLHPVMEKYRDQILQNYREAIHSAL